MHELIDRLFSDPRGHIVLWNFVDCHEDSLLKRDEIREFFLWWRNALPIVENTPPILVDPDPLFATLDLLKLDPDYWAKLCISYPDLESLGIKPEFRVLCKWGTDDEVSGGDGCMLTTVGAEVFFSVLGADQRDDLLGTVTLDTTSDGVALRTMIGGIPTSARAARLKGGVHLGRPGGVFWYTTCDSIRELIHERDADGICDWLGLIHIDEGVDLLALEFDVSVLASVLAGRPTAIDAGGHRRFKASPDDGRKRHAAWGCATDLAKLEKGEAVIDGGVERVCHSIAINSIKDINVHPVGRTVRSRKELTDDTKFSDRLARGRDKVFLRSAILGLVT